MQFEEWEEQNNLFLADALAWIHNRLESVAKSETLAGPEEQRDVKKKTPEKPSKKIRGMQGQHYLRSLRETEALSAPPALVVLQGRFHLSEFEVHVLLLCIAMELDTRMTTWCAQAQGHPNLSYPTFALAMKVFEKPAWEALSPERPLRYWRLLEVRQGGTHPLIMSPLKADECIVHFVKGLNYVDDRLSSFLMSIPFQLEEQENLEDADTVEQRLTHHFICKEILAEWEQGRRPIINLIGPDRETKQERAGMVAHSLGCRLYRLPIEWLPQQMSEIDEIARLWQRQSLLLNVGLFIDAHEHEKTGTSDGHISAVNRLMAKTQGLLFLATRDVWSYAYGPMLQYEISKPSSERQYQAWVEGLRGITEHSPGLLAGQFSFSLPTIQRLVRTTFDGEHAEITDPDTQIWDACLKAAQPNLDKLAQRLDAKATWDDLVLPKKETCALQQIVSQVRHRNRVYEEWGFSKKMNRGLGISVVFAGESGTGKTMAAEVIANELRLNLYRIDLSGVVSKYIGETEKNLRRVFDAAEDGGAILFFDEADALFGKRSDVKDSHDRYANIEVNYLLQRLEAYRGLAIMATNMRQAMDSAFVRRLRFIVNFPFPSRTERMAIWNHVLPPEVPQEGMDMERLSRFTLTGGSIHAIALHTAFLAADNGGAVTMPHVLEAIRAELRKQDSPIVETEFQ